MPSLTKHMVELLVEEKYGEEAMLKMPERMRALNTSQLRGVIGFFEMEDEMAASHLWRGANRAVLEEAAEELAKRDAIQAEIDAAENDRQAQERARIRRQQQKQQAEQMALNMLYRKCEQQALDEVTEMARNRRNGLRVRMTQALERGERRRNRLWFAGSIFIFLAFISLAFVSQLASIEIALFLVGAEFGVGISFFVAGWVASRVKRLEYTDEDFERDRKQRADELLEKKKVQLKRLAERRKAEEKRDRRERRERRRQRKLEEKKRELARRETKKLLMQMESGQSPVPEGGEGEGAGEEKVNRSDPEHSSEEEEEQTEEEKAAYKKKMQIALTRMNNGMRGLPVEMGPPEGYGRESVHDVFGGGVDNPPSGSRPNTADSQEQVTQSVAGLASVPADIETGTG
mmetsp:Transcript_43981/g.138230  ORF Transcript_43981/g.138230 Transcript_43981/m.138230 type:complete len:403 (-) Transcript_43981:92-1300(-)|eukprot:CAMPEP_0118883130 /NCGR_PEP_ID=MMETSP1163-20130328/22244_1 /TAXON_ID=124430 /ORGANISM="Phaeomonas parva, Strain CCMP2877" /LENGTH=402 /DNA_ID=CAMNT_0006820437 /DNA_START=101 /DNA_END=1309 /DNA_ORIENTATION=+